MRAVRESRGLSPSDRRVNTVRTFPSRGDSTRHANIRLSMVGVCGRGRVIEAFIKHGASCSDDRQQRLRATSLSFS